MIDDFNNLSLVKEPCSIHKWSPIMKNGEEIGRHCFRCVTTERWDVNEAAITDQAEAAVNGAEAEQELNSDANNGKSAWHDGDVTADEDADKVIKRVQMRNAKRYALRNGIQL